MDQRGSFGGSNDAGVLLLQADSSFQVSLECSAKVLNHAQANFQNYCHIITAVTHSLPFCRSSIRILIMFADFIANKSLRADGRPHCDVNFSPSFRRNVQEARLKSHSLTCPCVLSCVIVFPKCYERSVTPKHDFLAAFVHEPSVGDARQNADIGLDIKEGFLS